MHFINRNVYRFHGYCICSSWVILTVIFLPCFKLTTQSTETGHFSPLGWPFSDRGHYAHRHHSCIGYFVQPPYLSTNRRLPLENTSSQSQPASWTHPSSDTACILASGWTVYGTQANCVSVQCPVMPPPLAGRSDGHMTELFDLVKKVRKIITETKQNQLWYLHTDTF